MKNPSATLEEREIFFSVKRQPIHERMKKLDMNRKKRLFFCEERDEEKRNEFSLKIEAEEKSNIVHIDESGIKNTLRN